MLKDLDLDRRAWQIVAAVASDDGLLAQRCTKLIKAKRSMAAKKGRRRRSKALIDRLARERQEAVVLQIKAAGLLDQKAKKALGNVPR